MSLTPRAKLLAPEAKMSAKIAITASAASGPVDSDGDSISGCLFMGYIVQSASNCVANETLTIYDGSTEKFTALLSETASAIDFPVLSMPAPIPITNQLKIKTSNTATELSLRVIYMNW